MNRDDCKTCWSPECSDCTIKNKELPNLSRKEVSEVPPTQTPRPKIDYPRKQIVSEKDVLYCDGCGCQIENYQKGLCYLCRRRGVVSDKDSKKHKEDIIESQNKKWRECVRKLKEELKIDDQESHTQYTGYHIHSVIDSVFGGLRE